MTVTTSTNNVVYRGNGATTEFAVPFKVLDVDHLVVKRQVYATGVLDYTYVGTDYTYDGIGDDAGTLTLDGTALDDDYQLVIERIVPYTQDLDIVNAGGFYPETVEEQLDLTVMGLQQLADLASRGVVVPVGEDGVTLPGAALRASRYLGFNASGEPVALEGSVTAGDVISIPTVTNYGEVDTAVEAAATLTAALADAGLGGMLYNDAEADIGSAIANPGADMLGWLALYYGTRVQNLPGRMEAMFGRERMAGLIMKIEAGTAVTVGFMGNSTGGGAHLGGILQFLLGSYKNVTIVDYSASGTALYESRAGSGDYSTNGKSLANILAGPTLHAMFIHFEHNEPAHSVAAATYVTQLSSTIDDLRGVWSSLEICVVGANTMNGAGGRTQLAVHRFRPGVRALADKKFCVYFGAYELFPDAYVAANWTDGVHPGAAFLKALVRIFMDWLLGDGWAQRFMWQTAVVAATLPSGLPKGLTCSRATTGFPADGGVITFNALSTAGHFALQINFPTSVDNAPTWIRWTSATDSWDDWAPVRIEYTGSATYDPGNLVDGAGVTTTVTCTSANLGGFAEASFSLDLQGITLTAWVSAANTVSVRFQNETGGAIDLASGTLRVRVRPA